MIRMLFWITIFCCIIPATAQESIQEHTYHKSLKHLKGTWYLYLPDPHNHLDSIVALRKFKGSLQYVGSVEFVDSTSLIFKKSYKCATGVDLKKEYAPRLWQLSTDRLWTFGRYSMKIELIYNDTMILKALKQQKK